MNPPFLESKKTFGSPLDPVGPASRRSFARAAGFTLVELLAVMAIIITLSVASVPALQSLKGAGSVNKAVADLSRTLELARTYAMANRTYVRVLLSQPATGNGRMLPSTIVIAISSADGSTTSGAAADMADASKWPSLNRPLVLENLKTDDTLQGVSPVDTSGDITPMGANASGTLMESVTRDVGGWGSLTFNGVVQFGPTGEARVCFDEPARYIKLAMDQPKPGSPSRGSGKNPFALRLSGVNGSIKVLRAGELAL